MDRPIALAHGPEGAGNATRMLAIAEELRRADAEFVIAGGGPGAGFLEMNGFSEYEPTTLDFIAKREGDPALLTALAHAGPRVARRFADFYRWLDEEDPAVVLTDDPFAALPAMLHGIPWYRIDHSSVACYDDPFERLAFRIFNGFSLRASEGFFFTSVFEDPYPTRENLIPVGPIAHEPDEDAMEDVEPFDVLVIPGTYSEGFEEMAAELEAEGLSVTMVGGPDWEAAPSMLPYHAAADVVVCTGFSSLAEAVVAGTPVVVYPFIDCQQGIADQIEARGVEGIEVVHSTVDAIAAIQDPPDPPSFENGAPAVADHLRSAIEGDPDRGR